MSEYKWQWEQGDGTHEWLRDKSRTVQERRMAKGGSHSASIGFIDIGSDGWEVCGWEPRRELAMLPITMTRDEVKTVAKIILISEYNRTEVGND